MPARPQLKPEERALSYAKYYDLPITPIPPEKLAVLQAGPIDPKLALPIERRNDLLNPGYLDCEVGWCVMENGTGYLANLTPMPGVTPEMFNWWFAWHGLEDMRYRIWDPEDHFYARQQNPDRIKDPGVPMREKNWGTVHFVLEDIGPGPDELVELGDIATEADVEPASYKITEKPSTAAEHMNTFMPFMWVTGAFIFIYIAYSVFTKGLLGALNMNLVIFMFVGINCFLFPQPRQWIEAHKNSMHLATDVMLQFPFYGAIMGMMYVENGLGAVLVNGMVSIANAQTLPIFSFLSACVVNLFVPSQGSQFTVQGPLIVEAARQIDGANLVNCLNAFVYGDECTNLLQPLYVIPALSVVGMKLKDVWGFMAFICMFWLVIVCLGLYFIPMFV